MSDSMFAMATRRNPIYESYKIGERVKLKDCSYHQSSIIVGYMDISNGGLLLKDALSNGDGGKHLWYIDEVIPIR